MIKRILKALKLTLELSLYTFTAVAAIALLFAYMASAVDPASNAFFIPFGLAAPFIIGVNMLLALFWIIRWKLIALVPLLLLISGYGVISRHVRVPIFRQYDKPAPGDIRIMTYNVHTFRDASWNSSIDRISRYVRRVDPDILAIQEYYASSSTPADTISAMMGDYPYSKVFHIRRGQRHGEGYGLALYSRYKIARSYEILFDDQSNGCLYADLVIDNDTVRLFNCHMQTTDITDTDIALVEGVEQEKRQVKTGFLRIVEKLKTNGVKRSSQARIIASQVRMSPYPVILCGDFNDVPASYTYRKMSQGLYDGFKEAGRGYAHSFRELHGLFNVDYIFYSPYCFECVSYGSPSRPYSDHDPVVARLRKIM